MTTQRSAVQRGEWIDPADGLRTFAAVADEWRDTWTDLGPRTRHGRGADQLSPRDRRLTGVRPGPVDPVKRPGVA